MKLPPGLRLSVEEHPAQADCAILAEGIAAYNRAHLAEPGYAPLGIFVRNREGEVLAGIDAAAYAGWLFVHTLWVAPGLRHSGIGRELLMRAERYGAEHGCHSAWLYTYSFQAPEFYRKLGYEPFGMLEAADHRRIFLRKRLGAGAS